MTTLTFKVEGMIVKISVREYVLPYCFILRNLFSICETWLFFRTLARGLLMQGRSLDCIILFSLWTNIATLQLLETPCTYTLNSNVSINYAKVTLE